MFGIKNVSRSFKQQKVLNDISFEINYGMNFIIGPSGSGKTTLLRILSAMDKAYSGEVYFNGKEMKSLTSAERQDYYNGVFGFISQSFDLIEELTVYENLCLPQYLKGDWNKKEIYEILKSLKINQLANQKVSKLSGGQKQRVAIARELLKNPEVIIADEPTAALDPTTAQEIIHILKTISKNKCVIVVTHDTSLIDASASVYELDKGDLTILKEQEEKKSSKEIQVKKSQFSIKNVLRSTKVNLHRFWGRSIVSMLVILVCAGSLGISLGGNIDETINDSFAELEEKYGNQLLDMTIAPFFMGAAGENAGKEVTQDIGELYDRYYEDTRVEYILLNQYLRDVSFHDGDKSYQIEGSNSAPAFKELLAGRMPTGSEKEVLLSSVAVKRMGYTNDNVLGKEITIKGEVFNDDRQKVPVEFTAKVVGVVDATVRIDDSYAYVQEDCMFFSKSVVEDIALQSGKDLNKSNITLHAKTPYDAIVIQDELLKEGIVPIGYFELLTDIVKLNQQTKAQGLVGNGVISAVSVFALLSISFIISMLRRKEFAIYKMCGFKISQIGSLIVTEFIGISAVSLLILSTYYMVSGQGNRFGFGAIVLMMCMVVSSAITMMVVGIVNPMKTLKTGER